MNLIEEHLLKHFSFLKLTSEHPSQINAKISSRFNDLSLTLHDTGILSIEPEHCENLDILISSGIHGNETAPIEICDQLIKDILIGKIVVKNRLLFIIGNPVAMNEGKRFITENLNRLFCGKHSGKNHLEARRAAVIESVTAWFFNTTHEKCHFDLHTAIRPSKYQKFAIYPFQDGREWKKPYLNFFAESEINTMLLGHQASGTYSYHTSHLFKANAFTVELGQVKPFGQNDMASFSGIVDNLTALIRDKYQWQDSYDSQKMQLFEVDDEVLKNSEDNFKLHIDSDFKNFSEFSIGFQLTSDDNSGYVFKKSGQAVVFPNAKVPVGQRVALIVSKTMI